MGGEGCTTLRPASGGPPRSVSPPPTITNSPAPRTAEASGPLPPSALGGEGCTTLRPASDGPPRSISTPPTTTNDAPEAEALWELALTRQLPGKKKKKKRSKRARRAGAIPTPAPAPADGLTARWIVCLCAASSSPIITNHHVTQVLSTAILSILQHALERWNSLVWTTVLIGLIASLLLGMYPSKSVTSGPVSVSVASAFSTYARLLLATVAPKPLGAEGEGGSGTLVSRLSTWL